MPNTRNVTPVVMIAGKNVPLKRIERLTECVNGTGAYTDMQDFLYYVGGNSGKGSKSLHMKLSDGREFKVGAVEKIPIGVSMAQMVQMLKPVRRGFPTVEQMVAKNSAAVTP